jgi:flavin-binding protein dodecin
MWKLLLGGFNSYKWLIAGVGLAASIFTITNYFEQKGYNRAVVELQGKANEAIKKATDKAITKAQKNLQKALDNQQDIFDSELDRVKSEKKVEVQIEKVYQDAEKIYIKTECNTISDDVIKLLNNSVNNSNAASAKD